MLRHLVWVAVLLTLGGCSSLPKSPPAATELNSRTASLHKLGREHYRAGRLTKAEVYFDKALAIHAAVDDEAGVAVCYLSKGRVELARGHTDEAVAFFEQARISIEGLGRPDLMAQALGGKAAVYQSAGQHAEARPLLESALALPLQEKCRERAVLLHDLGVVHRNLSNLDEARSVLEQSLALHQGSNDRSGIATACYTLALVHEDAGERELALASARRALANDKAVQNARGVDKDLGLLATLHERAGQEAVAADYRRRAELARRGTLE